MNLAVELVLNNNIPLPKNVFSSCGISLAENSGGTFSKKAALQARNAQQQRANGSLRQSRVCGSHYKCHL